MRLQDHETLELGHGNGEGGGGGGGGDRLGVVAEGDLDPFLPAEGVEQQIGEGIEWEDFRATYDRDDSTKGTSNPKSHRDHRPQQSTSQRLSGSLKTAAPIIGLPSTMQGSGFLGRSRKRPSRARIFPKKASSLPRGGGNAGAPPEYEPHSPMVSCFGKVLSQRERDRDRRRQHRSWFLSLLCFCGGGGVYRASDERREKRIPISAVEWKTKSPDPPLTLGAAAAPGLGAMKRFVSGRRSASWVGVSDDGVDSGFVAARSATRGSLDV